MQKHLIVNSPDINQLKGIALISNGGTGTDNLDEALSILEAIPNSSVNEPLGVAGLDADGHIPFSLITTPSAAPTITVIDGPSTVDIDETELYTIVNYSPLDTYTVTANIGTVSINANTITYTAPSTVQSATIAVNGTPYQINIVPGVTILTPSVQSPTNGAVNTSINLTATSNPFFTAGGSDTHASTDWQVSTNNSFTNIVQSSIDSTTNKTTWAIPTLTNNTTYYIRVRYKGTTVGYSEWSTTNSFTTIPAVSINTPSITSSTSTNNSISFTSSAFATTNGSDTHVSSDWQLSTNSSFTNIVTSVTASTSSKTTWTASGLSSLTTYYARVRYNGASAPVSSWSSTHTKATVTVTVNTPTLSAALQSSGINVILTTSAFATTNGSDTHVSTIWSISRNSAFTNLFTEYTDTNNKTSVNFNIPNEAGTTFWARAKHVGAVGGQSSWSSAISFTMPTPTIQTPTLHRFNNYNGASDGYEANCTALVVLNGSDTQISTEYQISTTSTFSSILQSTVKTNLFNQWLVTIAVTGFKLYVRARTRGQNLGWSAWSATFTHSINTPTVTPTGGTIAKPSQTFVSSAFGTFSSSTKGIDRHYSSDWQLSTNTTFTNLVVNSLNNTTDLTSTTILTGGLTTGATYYGRMRHNGLTGGPSSWTTTKTYIAG